MIHQTGIVIIGAGVIGLSVAAHLALLGRTDVTVLDAGVPGQGSTSRATGGFRVQFGSAINIRLSLLSLHKLHDFRREHRVDPGFDQAGYLFLATTKRELDALQVAVALQHENGYLESRMVSREQALQLNPAFVDDSVLGGSFGPADGYIKPMQILEGYRNTASKAGITICGEAAVTAIRAIGNMIESVEIASGDRYRCEAVVNAAGPQAAVVAAMGGFSLPVTPLRRDVAATVATRQIHPNPPMTIWLGDGFHYRFRDDRILFLSPDSAEQSGSDLTATISEAFFERIESTRRKRVPSLSSPPIDRSFSWSGLYEMSPDHHAILGADSRCSNLFFANGSSGHGVMHAPAIGQLVAEMLVFGSSKTLDVTQLRPARFQENDPVPHLELL